MIDYSYLTPPSKVNRIKHPQNYIYEKINGKHVRRIFTRSIYQNFQKDAITKLKDYLKKKAPNIYYPDQLLLRFNYAGNFLFSEVTEKVRLYDEWHQNQIIVNLNKMGRQILQYGHIYAYGRDYDYCPVIIVRPNKFDFKKYQHDNYLNAIACLLQPLESYMLKGGVIQKWNIIIDFQNKKSIIDSKILVPYINRIVNAYPFRLKRLLYYNINNINQPAARQITDVLKNYDAQIEIQTIKQAQSLIKYISIQERQKKYGGNLLNICQYWPIHTTNKYEQTESNISKTEYESVMNDAVFFEEPKPSFCDMSDSKCNIY